MAVLNDRLPLKFFGILDRSSGSQWIGNDILYPGGGSLSFCNYGIVGTAEAALWVCPYETLNRARGSMCDLTLGY